MKVWETYSKRGRGGEIIRKIYKSSTKGRDKRKTGIHEREAKEFKRERVRDVEPLFRHS